jgi:prefoldin subunit 5
MGVAASNSISSMLKSELDAVIEYYETEKNNLEFLIKECVEEMDYFLAHQHFRALRRVNSKLQTLHNLKDPHYDSKESLERWKALYEDRLYNEKSEGLSNYYKEKIESLENELHELNNSQKKFSRDGQELDDCIYDLAEGNLSAFKFYLKKEGNFFLELRRINDLLIISFPPNADLQEYSITDSNLKSLISLGFCSNEVTGRLEYTYDLKSFSNSIFVKTLIARIIFDVYYYKELDNPTFIEKLTI